MRDRVITRPTRADPCLILVEQPDHVIELCKAASASLGVEILTASADTLVTQAAIARPIAVVRSMGCDDHVHETCEMASEAIGFPVLVMPDGGMPVSLIYAKLEELLKSSPR